ncbi:MAG: radical SAM protein [bacterium]|nr:radical SAM protein [bacterium]
MLTLRGVVLPESGDRPELPLELADLQVLRQMAATGTMAWAGDRPALVAELAARGISPLGAAPADRPLAPAPGAPGAPPRLDDFYIVTTPAVLCVGPAGFEQVSEDGRLLARLDAVELLAASEFCKATTAREALARHAARAGAERLDERTFLRVLARLMASGLLLRFDLTDTAQGRALSREDRDIRRAIAKQMELAEVVRRDVQAYDAQEQARAARTGVIRPRIVPIHSQWKITPLALGMIVAYAKQYDGGRLDERYDFRPDWLTDPARASSPKTASLFLFSHYIWSSVGNLELSAQLKASDPRALTVHGGPNVPKYEKDLEAYFRMHPHVDIAVRGEGEVTAAEMLSALAEVIDDPRPDLAVLEKVPGLAFRLGDRIVRTPDRERITDLDVIPSPYLTGLFDSFGKASTEAAVIESNRGCPYGCTFCDWGSATAQRIRKFSLERVFEEIEWCARHGVETIGLADANFGVFERDVAIAEKVAEVKARYGYPRHFGVNYAKNSLKHLKPIVKILSGAGTIAYGQLSLQSMDPGTLETIERHNIKSEKYHELAQEFRQAGLPLFIDLMMGLPGSTVTSFRADLQQAIDREVIAKVYPTQLLVNSPMNDPEYRQEHDIQAKPGAFLTSCASFSTADYARMKEMRRVFLLLEKFGILRHVARHVRREVGVREMEFFERLLDDGRAARTRWPVLAFTLESVPNLMVPPGRWQLLLDEVRQYLTEVVHIADDSALDTVLTVQRLLLPARNRRFPDEVQLPHDYAAWYGAMLAAKDAGHLQDWPSVVPPLREYGPGTLRVSDPFDVCVFGIGHSVESDSFGVWELDSPISRPVVPLHSALG